MFWEFLYIIRGFENLTNQLTRISDGLIFFALLLYGYIEEKKSYYKQILLRDQLKSCMLLHIRPYKYVSRQT